MDSNTNGKKIDAFLGTGSKVVGAVSFTGPVQIDGEVEGEVNASDSLQIGESAVLKAKVIGKSEVVVRGTVHGDIVAQRLSLKKPAKIYGNIASASLSIEEGVVFEGKCTMNISGASDARAHQHSDGKKSGANL